MNDPSTAATGESDAEPPWTRSWDGAVTGLADLDAKGVIIAANEMFCDLTGLAEQDLASRIRWIDLLTAGSRLLYEVQIVALLHLAGAATEVMVDLASREGAPRPALMSARAVRDESARICGTRIAVTAAGERRRFETDLLQARVSAEAADRDSSHARRRLEVQAEATSALASSTDPLTAVQRLADVFVHRLADWCLIFIGNPSAPSTGLRWAAAHAEPSQQRRVERIAHLLPEHGTSSSLFARSLQGAPATLVTTIDEAHLTSSVSDPELRTLLQEIDAGSAIVAPSYAHGARVAVLVLVRDSGRTPFTEENREDVADMSTRTGIVIDNTRRYARDHADSMTLQQALLTSPPRIDGLEIEVGYLPTQDDAQVGGDWYDAYVGPDGVPVVAIGDVSGHDIAAAAAMGQLRGIMRTIGYTTAGAPSEILRTADLAARGLGTRAMASAVVARIEPSPRSVGRHPRRAVLRWSNAGHLPPMLITSGGQVAVLERPADVLLGVAPDRVRHDHTLDLDAGDTLLLYTDGLVERRGEDLGVGIARLASALARQHSTPLPVLTERLLRDLDTAGHDDIAVLAVRLHDDGPLQATRTG